MRPANIDLPTATAARFVWRVAIVVALAVVIFGKTPVPTGSTPVAPIIVRDHREGPLVERVMPQPVMPVGWRDLKFGMSEADVSKLVQGYREDAAIRWEQSKAAHLPTVRWDLRKIDYVEVDERYHEWSIGELDDGAANVYAWHDRGALIAIQLRSRAEPDAFSRKASEAYGATPQKAEFKFFDDRTKMQESRRVAIWRGDDMTAFVWTSGSSPMLLLWSNAAMAARAAEYQTALDAPATAARKAAKSGETGTKF